MKKLKAFLLIPLILIVSHLVIGEAKAENLTLTIHAGNYRILGAKDGYTEIEMDGFGATSTPGEPQLPAKTFMIALPPGAKVQGVHITGNGPVLIQGKYKIMPIKPTIRGASSEYEAQGSALQRARKEWQKNYDATYSMDEPYPQKVGSFLGQGQWRKYTYARVKFYPFLYHPKCWEFWPDKENSIY